jgi:hypothetical protein
MQASSLTGISSFIESRRRSQGKSLGISTTYGLDDRGVRVRIPVESRIFSSQNRPDWPWGPPNLLSNGCGRGVKLTTHLQLVPRPRNVDLYIHSPHTTSWHSAKFIEHRDYFNFIESRCTFGFSEITLYKSTLRAALLTTLTIASIKKFVTICRDFISFVVFIFNCVSGYKSHGNCIGGNFCVDDNHGSHHCEATHGGESHIYHKP